MTDSDDGKRYVFLDPDGTGTGQGWAHVIVAAPTGVVHRTQGGGIRCLPYEQEGYLITLFGRGLDEELRRAFGPRGGTARLREAVESLRLYGSTDRHESFPASFTAGAAGRSGRGRRAAAAAGTGSGARPTG